MCDVVAVPWKLSEDTRARLLQIRTARDLEEYQLDSDFFLSEVSKSPAYAIIYHLTKLAFCSQEPASDPNMTCWLANQYEYDQPMQWVCTRDANTHYEDESVVDHSEDSY